ncbi:MAG: ABC transporter permease [Hyperthermus sp.]|nr:MAG: ABC transporter permease [Hyperthermus sp.]
MAGIGRFLVSKLINTFVTLIVAVLFISVIFAAYSIHEKRGFVEEEFVVMAKYFEREYKDPVKLQKALEELKKEIMRKYGLTGNTYRDVLREVLSLIKSSLTFDFGHSRGQYFGTTDVGEQVKIALRNTMILFTTATLINTVIGIFLGVRIARRPGSLADRVVSVMGMVSWSLPIWWIGIIFLIIFSFYLGWFPVQAKDVYIALQRVPEGVSGFGLFVYKLKTWLYYMSLPLATIVLVSFGGWTYVVRNLVAEVLSQDFVQAARARGLPERRIIYGHVLRTSSPPIVTSVALALVGSFGGAIITEAVFGWPGTGLLYWVALLNGEARIVMATTYVLAVVFIIAILVIDLLYFILDPRVRVEAAR